MKRVMYLYLVLFIVLITGIPCGFTQISQPGTPPSFSRALLKSAIPVETMPVIDIQTLKNEDLIFDTIKDIPWRFGENISVNINPSNSGIWEYLDNHDKLWRTSIYSAGAYSINLTFNKYLLPPGAQLYIYNIEKTLVLGAFTDFNNQDDGYFATTLVQGDHIIIEYYEPANAAFSGELQLETVTHAYRNPYDYVKSFSKSGPCNINVACQQSKVWEKQIRSVAMMISGGNGFCTGALINNTQLPGKALFLTADHCNFTPGSVVLWFNWQSETCDNPSTSPPYNAMSGAKSLARNSVTDFHLLELNHDVPLEYKPFFAGWNRTTIAALADTIACVHHPRGDIKKFSYATDGIQSSNYGGVPGSGNSHWRVVWSGGTTTESASSGSPMFDAEGRIIGQLHGGGAACGNSLPDYFGKLGISWTGGGTASTSLGNWLDPGSTGVMTLDGFDPTKNWLWNPSGFAAEVISESKILLQWKPNNQDDLIILAYNTQDIFGVPSNSYSLGDEITNGGTIIYMGNDSTFVHDELSPGQKYYYKIWAYAPENKFSPGSNSHATTSCFPIKTFPYTEGFNETGISGCWMQEYEREQVEWQTGLGNDEGSPGMPYEGTKNAFLRTLEGNNPGNRVLLISPVMDFSSWRNATLSFYYTNPADFHNQDTLKILYRIHADSTWQVLETFGSDQVNWINAYLSIPVLSGHVQIAFEGQTNYGKGISLDAIEIKAESPDSIPTPVNLKANLENNFVNLTWEIENVPVKSFFDVEGVDIYRDNQLIFSGIDPSQNSFTDHALPVGIYHYFIKNRSTTGLLSNSSNTVEVDIQATGNEFSLLLEVNGSGKTYPAEGEYLFLPQSEVFIEALANHGWSFSHWNIQADSTGTIPGINLLMDEAKQVEAVFKIKQYHVNVLAEPAGAALSITGEGLYEHGTHAEFSALAAPGYVFQCWKHGDSVISTHAKIDLVVTNDKALTAHFISRTHSLTLTSNQVGAAIIDGSGVFGVNTKVTVAARANQGWNFRHWSIVLENEQLIVSNDSVYTFILTNDTQLVATFNLVFPSLIISQEGKGIISPEPGEYDRSFKEEIILMATPADSWEFVKWDINGDSIGTPEFILQIEENTIATAIFAPLTNTRKIEDVRILKLFPVPASDMIFFELPEGDWFIKIIGITGSILGSREVLNPSNQVQSLDISDLPPGVYFMVAENKTNISRGRFVVN
jgi:hypothetical protein